MNSNNMLNDQINFIYENIYENRNRINDTYITNILSDTSNNIDEKFKINSKIIIYIINTDNYIYNKLNDDTNSIIDTNYLSLFLFNISITELNIKFKNKNKHNSSQNTNAIERIFTEFILIHPEYNKDASNKSLTHILNKDRQVYSLQDIYSLYTSGSNIIQFLAMSAEYMPNLPYESTLDVFYNNNNSSRFMPTSYRNLFKLSYVNDAFNNGGIFIFDPRLAYLIQTDRSDIWNISYYNTSNLNGIDMIDRIVILIFQKYASLKRYLYSKNRSYASDIYKKPYKDISNELRDINKPLDKSINYESNWIEWENIPYSDTFTFNNYIETTFIPVELLNANDFKVAKTIPASEWTKWG